MLGPGLLLTGLLLPGLFFLHPHATHAETRSTRSPSKGTARQRSHGPISSCVHTVERGDSVSHVASRYGVTGRAVIAANKLAIHSVLRPGQRLTIPGCHSARSPREQGLGRPVVPADGLLLASVGPRRVPTQLFLGVPVLNEQAIDFVWPIAGPIISPFGRRRNGWHAGVDIKADLGTPILAAAPGTVLFSGWERSYGRVVRVQHAHGFVTLYAHNLQNFVEAGDHVEAGTVVATAGRSGRATAYHVHFEIRQDGTAYDPAFLLPERAVLVARADGAHTAVGHQAGDE